MTLLARVDLFGDVRVWVSGTEVPVPNARVGVLLAALVLARGDVLTTGELKALLWPSSEPTSAANQLHRLVGQVRRVFEPGLSARDVGAFVVGAGVGYRLDRTRVESDFEDCQAAIADAQRQGHADDWGAATDHYLAALRILGRPLLGDVSWERVGHPGLASVPRTRVQVAIQALDAARLCERLPEVITLVEQIAGASPFEEALQAELIKSLGRVGRRRDAMELHERIRAVLAEELGVDPGSELRAAYDELLQLDAPTRSETALQRLPVVPAQLPLALRGMTVRAEAQARLDEVAAVGEAGAVAITSIGGMGGIGKTTLAVAWARSLADRFPDGQLYVNLRGFHPDGQVMSPMDALGELLMSMDATPVNAEETLETRSARLRSLLADRKVLLLLDNARDAEQVRPLLPGSPGCLVIVTSRNQLSSLVVREGAIAVRLDRMTDEQARELLTQRLGAVRTSLEPKAVDRIIAAAAGLPLALAVVSARLAVEPELALSAVADELTMPVRDGSALSAWSAGDANDDLMSVFDWSYDLLDEDTARCFRLLAVHPVTEISLSAVASITGRDRATVRRVLSVLVSASLLERRVGDRYVLHDLLREYAGSRLDDPERRGAEARTVGHYVASTRNAWSTFGRPPVGDLDPISGLTGLSPDRFDNPTAAIAWYVQERAALPIALRLAVERGWDRAAANIAIDWRPMNQTVDTDSHTYPHALLALSAAERTGDLVLRAELHRDLGPKAARLGDLAAGERHLLTARELFSGLGDRTGEANALRNLSNLPTMSRDRGLQLTRAALAVVDGDEAPQVAQMLTVELAGRLLQVAPGQVPPREACLEARQLLVTGLSEMAARGWDFMVTSASDTLARALLLLARPREALEVALDGCRFADSDVIDLAFITVRLAESALAAGEYALAARTCRDFQQQSEARSDFVEEVLQRIGPHDLGEGNPFERVEAVLARLQAHGEG